MRTTSWRELGEGDLYLRSATKDTASLHFVPDAAVGSKSTYNLIRRLGKTQKHIWWREQIPYSPSMGMHLLIQRKSNMAPASRTGVKTQPRTCS
jgi:hypothetical protein